MKLLITGGHVTPALAVIDELKKRNDIQVVFVGRRYSSERSREETLEYKEIKNRNIPFVHLKTGRLTRVFSIKSVANLFRVPMGFFNAYRVLRKYRPDRILSFGGYIALPITIAGAFLRIPIYTHEQTIHPGLANKVISRFAKRIFLSFEESKKYFKRKKVIVTGNPIRTQALHVINKPFTVSKSVPVIYVTGGSLGSHAINSLIEEILPELVDQYLVIHQTGNVKEFKDFERLTKAKSKLSNAFQKRYIVQQHFTSEDIGYIYSVTDLVIGRAGANTFFELLALQKPAIFIPLPWSAHQEQQKQGELFKKWGVGEVFDQTGKSKELLQLIDSFMNSLETYKSSFNNVELKYADKAAELIIKNVVG